MQVELNNIPVTILKKGSYFGEIALLRNVRRTASVRALSETCDLFVLTKVRAAGHSSTKPQHRPLKLSRMLRLSFTLSSCACLLKMLKDVPWAALMRSGSRCSSICT